MHCALLECGLRSGHFRDLSIISQWAKHKLPVYASAGASLHRIASYKAFIDTSSEFLFAAGPSKDHLGSSEITYLHFFSTTCGVKKILAWVWCYCVSIFNAHRLMCNLICNLTMCKLGHHVTLTCGQILTLTFQDQIIHCSTRLDETTTMVPPKSLFWLEWKMVLSKTVIVDTRKFDIFTSGIWWPKFWPESKIPEMVCDYFCTAFKRLFRLLYYAQKQR